MAEGADTSVVYVLKVDGYTGEPLYVVDGVIVGHGVIDLEALSIESIEVIKGATAKGLYGDRATNGVIIITAKGGKPEADGKLGPVVERKN